MSQTATPVATCRICGGSPTIKAHLIQESFVKEIQVSRTSGEQHLIVEADGGPTRKSPTGWFSQDILCQPCDGKLGVYENEALKLFRRLRAHKVGKKTGTSSVIREGAYPFRVRDTNEFIRFACGILWKYGSSSPSTPGYITLGPFLDILADVCFRNGAVPDTVDVAIERDLTSFAAFTDPTDVYYYRNPSMGVRGGRRVAWFSVAGFIVYVRLDASGASDHLPPRFWMRGKKQHHFQVAMSSLDVNADVGASIRRVEGNLAKLNAKALASVSR
jgi:hypothetical protein